MLRPRTIGPFDPDGPRGRKQRWDTLSTIIQRPRIGCRMGRHVDQESSDARGRTTDGVKAEPAQQESARRSLNAKRHYHLRLRIRIDALVKKHTLSGECKKKMHFGISPPAPGADLWGLVVTGAGYCRSLPGQSYPPERHPRRSHVSMGSRPGSSLVFQILGLLEGRGELESSTRPTQRLIADSAFLIAPGQWPPLSSRPQRRDGSRLGSNSRAWYRTLWPARANWGKLWVVRNGVGASGLWVAIDAVLQRVRNALPGVNPGLSSLALEALKNRMEPRLSFHPHRAGRHRGAHRRRGNPQSGLPNRRRSSPP